MLSLETTPAPHLAWLVAVQAPARKPPKMWNLAGLEELTEFLKAEEAAGRFSCLFKL